MSSRRGNRGRDRRKNRSTKPGKPLETSVTVRELGRHGHGIAEINGQRIFVPFTLPGEIVRVRVAGDHAELLEIAEPSPKRTEPACTHFGSCGGCAVQHLAEEEYLQWKQGIVETALRNQGLEVNVDPIVDAHGEGRRRVSFHLVRKGGKTSVGFMQARSHRMEDIEACPVLEPELSGLIGMAHALGNLLLPRDGKLDVSLTGTETGVDCNVSGRIDVGYEQHMALSELAEQFDLARLSLNGETVAERRRPELVIGPARLTPPSGGFLQATGEGERVLSALVAEHLVDTNSQNTADLFCGIGAYALRLAEQRQVFAADNSAEAIAALESAVRHATGLKPVATSVRDLFDDPLLVDELGEFDAVVFNPPRAGAASQVFEIVGAQVPTVVAVSCDPSTFARDARILVDGGYDLLKVTPVDQFKWAAHVELVALFRRSDAA